MFCIDASVIISALRPQEPYSERSRAFLDRTRGNQLKVFLPEIALAEIASGLYRATRNADFVSEVISSLRSTPAFYFVAVDSKIVSQAVNVILKTGLRSLGALYIALAIEYNLVLITLDKEQASKGGQLIHIEPPS